MEYFELFIRVLIMALIARYYAELVAALIQFIDPQEQYIFSWYGRLLDKWSHKLAEQGKGSFWLKPLGLCPVCFGIWCAIAGSVFFCNVVPLPYPVCFTLFVGSVWHWAFED